jgi:hypothetical protein
MFRLTRGTVERLIQKSGTYAPAFSTTKENCMGKPPIASKVKVLGILKCFALGCSRRVFMDYHQMAPNTFTQGLKEFFRAIKADASLSKQYMRSPSLSDIKRITEQHESMKGCMVFLVCWVVLIACTFTGRIVLLPGKNSSRMEDTSTAWLLLKVSLIITFGFGMHLLVTQRLCWQVHSTNAIADCWLIGARVQ